jgi:hypothetical protein
VCWGLELGFGGLEFWREVLEGLVRDQGVGRGTFRGDWESCSESCP